eukprot:6369062-Pyramimonas_sp.AAC.1
MHRIVHALSLGHAPARIHWDTCRTRTFWDVLRTHPLGHEPYSTRALTVMCSGTHPLGHAYYAHPVGRASHAPTGTHALFETRTSSLVVRGHKR